MKKQELANKSGTEKKSQVLQARSSQKGPELSGPKLDDYFQQINAESFPESFVSILSRSEFSHPANASQKEDMISHLQQTYGNAHIQRTIQAKLKIGQPNDKYEQEADRVADEVMRMKARQAWRQSGGEEKGDEIPRTKEIPKQAPEVASDLDSTIPALKGGGQPLSQPVRAFFEPRFCQDFSSVRVHNNAKAGKIARVLNAKAFTVGRDIVFGTGQYAPETIEGKRLFAHELTHVIQQEQDLTPSVQMVPMKVSDLALRAEMYGKEKLKELSKAREDAVEKFISELTEKMESVVEDVTTWTRVIAGGIMAFFGVVAIVPIAVMGVGGTYKSKEETKKDCRDDLKILEKKWLDEVEAHKTPFESLVRLANKFAEDQAESHPESLDTDNLDFLKNFFDKNVSYSKNVEQL